MLPRLATGLAPALALVALLALGACQTPHEGRVDPALFPRQTDARAIFDGPVAVLTDATSLETVVLGEALADRRPMQMPIGRIVHEASLEAFAEVFKGGVQAVDRLGGGPATAMPLVAVRLANFVYRDRLRYIVPLLFVSVEKWRLDVQIAVDVRLLDDKGEVLWSSTYDSGVQVFDEGDFTAPTALLERPESLVRLTHETAFRLMQQAARDVGEWLRKERLRERRL